jgi:hypothetical protein
LHRQVIAYTPSQGDDTPEMRDTRYGLVPFRGLVCPFFLTLGFLTLVPFALGFLTLALPTLSGSFILLTSSSPSMS